MKPLVVTRRIAAPRDVVWRLATDLAGAPSIMRGIVRVEVLTTGEFGAGTRWRETRRMFGREATEELTVASSEPPERYVVTAESHGARYESVFSFAAVDEGTTEATMSFAGTATGTVSKVMSLLTGPLAAKSVRTALEQDLADLAAAAESAGA